MTQHEGDDGTHPTPWNSTGDLLKFTWESLNKTEHKKLTLAAVINGLLSIVDFVALLAIAAVMGLVVASLDDDFQSPAIPLLGEQLESPGDVIITVGIASVVLIALKTLVGYRLLRRIFLYTATLHPKIANQVYAVYLRAPYSVAQGLSRASVSAAVNGGAMAAISAIRAVIGLIADGSLIFLMMLLLLVADFWVFLGSVAYFGLLAFITSKLMGNRLSTYGKLSAIASVKASETVLMSVGFSPEIRLYGMAENFKTRLARDQLRTAEYTGLQQLMFLAPRFLFEVGLLVGFLAVAGLTITTQPPADAAVTIGLFALASVRLVPALQRLNMNLGTLRLNVGQSRVLKPVLELLDFMNPKQVKDYTLAETPKNDPLIDLRGINYRYPGSARWALQDINLQINPGQTIAFVGSTGSGKSTLARVVAGLVDPTSGELKRSESLHGEEEIAIVPQNIYISPDTIRNNIALSILGQTPDDEDIWQALHHARLADFVSALPEQLDTKLGENGTNLSGGEAQRLAIARALYRKPKFLVLDEATSSLDATTEAAVTDSVRINSPDCTLVVVAHRLATIRNANKIVFLRGGTIVDQGNFGELAERVPDFAKSANLQGL